MSKLDKKYEENYKLTLAKRNVILLVKAGSELLGMNTEDSDRDELGIFIEEPIDLAGFDLLDTITYRSATDRTGNHNAKSEPSDVDLTLYGLRKYLKLALGGNPNLLQLLFAPKPSCIIRTEVGEALQALAPKIVSRRCADAFRGYLNAQRLRLNSEVGGMGVNRNELVAKYGYDTHYAMHMMRLGYQGLELVRTGKLALPLNRDYQDYFKNIKIGYESKTHCLRTAASYEEQIEDAIPTSPLPEKPDYTGVEEWLLEQYKKYWRMNG